jgi:aminoglycoside phosphotransferase (APT) family kinase protein
VLAPRLPLPIPTPVAKGTPDSGFPYTWSEYRWLDGDLASKARIGDLTGFATTLARFLNALGRIDATGGPEPGQHNFFRGGPLATYERQTLEAIDAEMRFPATTSSGSGPTPWPPRGTVSASGSTVTSRPGTC